MRKGFTLVELSIVLVIIGLLIGGILVAQSMIGTAKISAQVRQIGQFDAMVANFKENYHYLPGDAPSFGGNGDGMIALIPESCGGCNDNISAFAAEIGNFWHDMDNSLFPGSALATSPGAQTNTTGSFKNVPLSEIGSTGSFFIASALGINGEFANTTVPQNFYAILSGSQAHSIRSSWYLFAPTDASNSSVKPSDAMALDSKIDDGFANTGNVLSGSLQPNPTLPIAAGIMAIPATGLCSSGATYYVENTGLECTPLIRIGAQTGEPQ